MRKTSRKRQPASEAVIALRKHMGLTQQRFAVEILLTSITTIARWETGRPPRGEMLLKLSSAAEKQRRPDLSATFFSFFMDDVIGLVPSVVVKRWAVANA